MDFPAARCSTFGSFDFMRVPLPAARTMMSSGVVICKMYQKGRKKAAKRMALAALGVGMVGVAGFELATPCTPCKCATRLRYTPNKLQSIA